MGRFATTVPYYRRYREPYPPAFFETIAQRLNFTGRERLADIGCGPAIGRSALQQGGAKPARRRVPIIPQLVEDFRRRVLVEVRACQRDERGMHLPLQTSIGPGVPAFDTHLF